MDCNCNKEKRSYHFHVCEVVEGKVQDVMSFRGCLIMLVNDRGGNFGADLFLS